MSEGVEVIEPWLRPCHNQNLGVDPVSEEGREDDIDWVREGGWEGGRKDQQ